MSRLRTRRYIFLAILVFLFLFIVAVAANLRREDIARQNITETFDEKQQEAVTPTEINRIEERSQIVYEKDITPTSTLSPTANSITIPEVPTIKKDLNINTKPTLTPIENQIRVTASPSENLGSVGYTTQNKD